MNLEEMWRGKTDEEVVEAAGKFGDYNEDAKQIIRRELERRGLDEALAILALRESEEKKEEAIVDQSSEKRMFQERDYVAFMLGSFILGGVLVVPLVYAKLTGLSYLQCLPWALAAGVVWLVAFRRNGSISLVRLILAAVALTIGAVVYTVTTNEPSFAGGGILGLLLLLASGHGGIAMKRGLQKLGGTHGQKG